MTIRTIRTDDDAEWLRMRRALWPEWPEDAQRVEMRETLSLPDIRTVLVFERKPSGLGGFVEVHIRKRVNNARSPLVAYIEGWYVDPDLHRQGIGRRLLMAAEQWAKQRGLTEMASDTEMANESSRQAHERLGFTEVYQLAHYLKEIEPDHPKPEPKQGSLD